MVRMGSNRKNTVFIGDQIFTDIWGAKKAGIYSILVKPIDKKGRNTDRTKTISGKTDPVFLSEEGTKGRKRMQIDGKTKTCGLIGDPVAHTLSPVIHNTLAQTRGDDLVYVPLRVEAEQVRKAVEGAYALSLTGLNVTVPHKSAVIPYLVVSIRWRKRSVQSIHWSDRRAALRAIIPICRDFCVPCGQKESQ